MEVSYYQCCWTWFHCIRSLLGKKESHAFCVKYHLNKKNTGRKEHNSTVGCVVDIWVPVYNYSWECKYCNSSFTSNLIHHSHVVIISIKLKFLGVWQWMKAKRQKMLNLPKTETVRRIWNIVQSLTPEINYQWHLSGFICQGFILQQEKWTSDYWQEQCLILNLYFIGSVPCFHVFLFALLTLLCVCRVHRSTTNLSIKSLLF